jgi:uncharacterized membrane protein YeaQ/YmgE (transglycosylase-associated protein family)
MIHFIVWIIVSGFAGFVASKIINKSGSGMLLDILIGILGGFIGGFIADRLPMMSGLQDRNGMSGFLIEVVIAILGSMLLIWVWNMLFRRGRAA